MTIANEAFQRIVWEYYTGNGRHELPWRVPEMDGSFDPYKILVSEIMLQQTQVPRVIPKYLQFLELFPTVQSLASAQLGEVISAWSGLGYNRRAKFLWQAAQMIQIEKAGIFPDMPEGLVALPGVGKNTAGAVLAYAWNKPAAFIETNIRTVYLHHFFAGHRDVDDKLVLEKLHETMPADNAREWYWALMDYGSYLKQTVGNTARASKAYARQSPFKGSRREVRGKILRLLTARPHTYQELQTIIADVRTADVLKDLEREGMLSRSAETIHLA